MVTRKKLTQAERMIAELRPNSPAKLFRGVRFELSPDALDPDKCLRMDGPLLEAIRAGLFGDGAEAAFLDLRRSLVDLALDADIEGRIELFLRAWDNDRVDLVKRNGDLIDRLQRYLARAQLARLEMEKLSKLAPEVSSAVIDDVLLILNLGEKLVPLMQKYAVPPERYGGAMQPEADYYFRSFAHWWGKLTVAHPPRGAKAIRDRLALALWLDAGRTVPGDRGAEWIKERFRQLGKKAVNEKGQIPL